MKISYDKEVDAAYIRLSEQEPSGVIEISKGINVDGLQDLTNQETRPDRSQ